MNGSALSMRSVMRDLAALALDGGASLGSWVLRRGASEGTREDPEKITVLALWGIGDAIFLIPLLRALRHRYPGAELEVVGKSFLRDVFLHDPAIDTVTVYAPPWTAATGKYRIWGKPYRELRRWLRERRAAKNDWIVTTRGDVREHVFAALMGGRRRFGYGQAGARRLLTDDFPVAPPLTRQRHFVDYSHEVARFVGCTPRREPPKILLTEGERAKARSILQQHLDLEEPVLGVHVGASFSIREWPVERFQAALESVRDHVGGVVVLADPQGCSERLRLPRGCGRLVFRGGLRDVLALLSQLDALLCNDSGIMHAAAALEVPVVAAFGPTSPVWFSPYGVAHSVVRNEALRCGPCSDHCRFRDPSCIRTVETAWVSKALVEVLDRAADLRRPRGLERADAFFPDGR